MMIRHATPLDAFFMIIDVSLSLRFSITIFIFCRRLLSCRHDADVAATPAIAIFTPLLPLMPLIIAILPFIFAASERHYFRHDIFAITPRRRCHIFFIFFSLS